jgi:hypothetical protein
MVQGQHPTPTDGGEVGPRHPTQSAIKPIGGAEVDSFNEFGHFLALLRS